MMASLCVLYLIEAKKNQSSNYSQARIRGYLAKAESQLKEESFSENQELLVHDMVSYSRFDRANSSFRFKTSKADLKQPNIMAASLTGAAKKQ